MTVDAEPVPIEGTMGVLQPLDALRALDGLDTVERPLALRFHVAGDQPHSRAVGCVKGTKFLPLSLWKYSYLKTQLLPSVSTFFFRP